MTLSKGQSLYRFLLFTPSEEIEVKDTGIVTTLLLTIKIKKVLRLTLACLQLNSLAYNSSLN